MIKIIIHPDLFRVFITKKALKLLHHLEKLFKHSMCVYEIWITFLYRFKSYFKCSK